jgi:hypothetical protein
MNLGSRKVKKDKRNQRGTNAKRRGRRADPDDNSASITRDEVYHLLWYGCMLLIESRLVPRQARFYRLASVCPLLVLPAWATCTLRA